MQNYTFEVAWLNSTSAKVQICNLYSETYANLHVMLQVVEANSEFPQNNNPISTVLFSDTWNGGMQQVMFAYVNLLEL